MQCFLLYKQLNRQKQSNIIGLNSPSSNPLDTPESAKTHAHIKTWPLKIPFGVFWIASRVSLIPTILPFIFKAKTSDILAVLYISYPRTTPDSTPHCLFLVHAFRKISDDSVGLTDSDLYNMLAARIWHGGLIFKLVTLRCRKHELLSCPPSHPSGNLCPHSQLSQMHRATYGMAWWICCPRI